MWSLIVVEPDPVINHLPASEDIVQFMQIDRLVFQATPKPLYFEWLIRECLKSLSTSKNPDPRRLGR